MNRRSFFALLTAPLLAPLAVLPWRREQPAISCSGRPKGASGTMLAFDDYDWVPPRCYSREEMEALLGIVWVDGEPRIEHRSHKFTFTELTP